MIMLGVLELLRRSERVSIALKAAFGCDSLFGWHSRVEQYSGFPSSMPIDIL